MLTRIHFGLPALADQSGMKFSLWGCFWSIIWRILTDVRILCEHQMCCFSCHHIILCMQDALILVFPVRPVWYIPQSTLCTWEESFTYLAKYEAKYFMRPTIVESLSIITINHIALNFVHCRSNCETEVPDVCSPDPCRNQALCLAQFNPDTGLQFSCMCLPGYEGM